MGLVTVQSTTRSEILTTREMGLTAAEQFYSRAA